MSDAFADAAAWETISSLFGAGLIAAVLAIDGIRHWLGRPPRKDSRPQGL